MPAALKRRAFSRNIKRVAEAAMRWRPNDDRDRFLVLGSPLSSRANIRLEFRGTLPAL